MRPNSQDPTLDLVACIMDRLGETSIEIYEGDLPRVWNKYESITIHRTPTDHSVVVKLVPYPKTAEVLLFPSPALDTDTVREEGADLSTETENHAPLDNDRPPRGQ